MDALIQGAKRPLIPPGEYEFRFIKYLTLFCFRNVPKLRLDFAVDNLGEYYGVILSRFYNVKKFKGKPGKDGKFVVTPGSHFTREFLTLFPDSVTRLDRLPMSQFKKNFIFTGKVETVVKTQRQKDTPKLLQYSVIVELLKVRDL